MTHDEGEFDELELRRRMRAAAEDAAPEPKPKTEPARSSRGRSGGGKSGGPNRPTAVGYGDDGGRYSPGQNVACRIVRAEPGGYEVRTKRENLPGFLPSSAKFREGEEVLAQFVCMSNNRMLLSLRTFDTSPARAASVQWLEARGKHPSGSAEVGEREAAFAVWVNDESVNHKLRRAVDLMVPPIGDDQATSTCMGDYTLDSLVMDLEVGMRTGCAIASCDLRKSRSSVLLYRGRAVGCIYGQKLQSEPEPTEPSLRMMLKDLLFPETKLLIYDLPEDVTLAMSALFLGYPVERNDDLDGRSYLDYIGSWLQQKEQIACLAISTSVGGTCLAFVHKGRYVGAYSVEEARFDPDIQFVFDLLNNDRSANISASILPPELLSGAVRFGFSLSELR